MKTLREAEQQLDRMLKNAIIEDIAVDRAKKILDGVCNEIVLQSYIKKVRKTVRINIARKKNNVG